MPTLTIQLAESAPVAHELTHDSIAIGRRDSNTIQIDDPSVSGSHAVLTRREDGDFTLEDLGSTNGTRINGRHVERATRLRNGDAIRFGKVETRYDSAVAAVASDDLADDAPGDSGATLVMGEGPLPQPKAPVAALAGAAKGKPGDFVNASPFPKRAEVGDPVVKALYGLAALAVVAFVVAVVLVMMLEAPKLAL